MEMRTRRERLPHSHTFTELDARSEVPFLAALMAACSALSFTPSQLRPADSSHTAYRDGLPSFCIPGSSVHRGCHAPSRFAEKSTVERFRVCWSEESKLLLSYAGLSHVRECPERIQGVHSTTENGGVHHFYCKKTERSTSLQVGYPKWTHPCLACGGAARSLACPFRVTAQLNACSFSSTPRHAPKGPGARR